MSLAHVFFHSMPRWLLATTSFGPGISLTMFPAQASALTNAVQQLRALLSVHMQRAQQRLRDMATPPMPPPAKAATAASSMLTAQQQQQQQQEDFAGMPPGTVQVSCLQGWGACAEWCTWAL
eukprot:1159146-Pelagomonas_calceolata.AAC.7